MNNHIPLIDLDIWRNGGSKERELLIQDVDLHLQKLGFLMVKNHGIDPTIRDKARRLAFDFFTLSEQKKQSYACPPEAYRGWVATGLESNASSYGANEGEELIVDLKEAYSVGPMFEGIEQYLALSPRWYAPNIWPDKDIPGFQKAFSDWWQAADKLTIELLEVIGTAIGLDRSWIESNCLHPMATVTANLYPKVDTVDGWRVGAHTDFGTITVLDRDSDNGLQIEVDKGEWVDAPTVEGAVTINLGEMMVLLSGGRWRANPHRVIATPGADKNLSLVYFHDPDFDCVLPLTLADGRPMTAADFLKQKMDQIIQGNES